MLPRLILMSLWIGGFCIQNNRLFKASILENVRVSRPKATREQVMAALMAAQCKDILDKLPDGLDTQIGTEGTYLSGGEQQRIALARAILKDAPIVLTKQLLLPILRMRC